MISAIEQRNASRTVGLLLGLCSLTVILGSCNQGRSEGDQLLECVLAAEGKLRALKNVHGQYPAENDMTNTLPTLTRVCKEWDLELTYSRSANDRYTLIISPRKLSNKVLGCWDGGFTQTYVLTPKGICEVFVNRDRFLPVTDPNVAHWLRKKGRGELATCTQPTTQPSP